MKLSEYIKAALTLQKELALEGLDPQVVEDRFSDLGPVTSGPATVIVLPHNDGEWFTEKHKYLTEKEHAKLQLCVHL